MTVEKKLDMEQNLYESAIKITKEAGDLVKKSLGSIREIEQKKNASDLVTEVDKSTEMFIYGKIKEMFPDHWLLSEEDCGQANAYEIFQKQSTGYGWIIDPIDGTTNFIHGIPHFAVSIGIVKNGEPVVGVVFNPITGDLYTARRAFGAFHNGQSLQVDIETKLSEAVVATGFQAGDFKTGSRVLQQMDQLAGKS
ncbi:MAG TPA: inositol monophosphatase family protein, partial [Sporolactobacillaceae bacterium]|nr:inositol monophosphatase family protein [Sporolactobacillaceae bacterium]